MPIDCRVAVVLQFKAECFRTRERHYDGRLQTWRLQAPIPYLTDSTLRRQLVYQTAEAEASSAIMEHVCVHGMFNRRYTGVNRKDTRYVPYRLCIGSFKLLHTRACRWLLLLVVFWRQTPTGPLSQPSALVAAMNTAGWTSECKLVLVRAIPWLSCASSTSPVYPCTRSRARAAGRHERGQELSRVEVRQESI